jgi:hypothetical protein
MQVTQGIYEHYKSKPGKQKLYQVLFLSHNEADLEVLVHYAPLYHVNDTMIKDGITIWTRTLKNFSENVIVEGKSVPRFKRVS